jgi:copper oxidase (laccase) domain-containing protein
VIAEELVEHFPVLDATGVCRSAFVRRIPGIDVSDNKPEVLPRLDAIHREVRHSLGMGNWPLITAEQIHGDRIALVDRAQNRDQELGGYDGFITDQRELSLGIHVADCCAVYIVDPNTPAIGLVHSGKKGTALAIVAKAVAKLGKAFGSIPADLIVQLSPCIRPPHYEIDFATDIVEQCRAAGVKQIHDCGVCTACDLARYYSYRAEKGKTGRMLALLGLV